LIGPVPYGFNIISNMHVISAGDYANLASIITSWAPVVNLLAVDMALDFDSAYTVVSHSRKIPVVVWGTDDELLKIKFSTPNNDLVGSGLLNAMLVVENQHLTVRAL